ncbi:uncharacterized protein LOC108980701 [Juglans regia]|uniref:Uncharacterized protein LOC108980701 n=1 Tax=Juglans regia TaxID=51240 RepID=A0A6P9FAR7_JUGRE|nr:uncharacterized protein LOC108980701 [Juglans regia]
MAVNTLSKSSSQETPISVPYNIDFYTHWLLEQGKEENSSSPHPCNYNPLLSHSISLPISSQTSIFPSSQEENSKPRDSCALCFPKPNLPSSSSFSCFGKDFPKVMSERLGSKELLQRER